MTIEEGSSGGFASLVLDSIARQRLSVNMRNFAPLYMPDFFVDHDSQTNQIARAQLDAKSIVTRAIEALRPVDRRARLARVDALD